MRRIHRSCRDFCQGICPECGAPLVTVSYPEGCESCNKPLRILKCTGTASEFCEERCLSCYDKPRKKPREADFSKYRQITNNIKWVFLLFLFVVFVFIIYCKSLSGSPEEMNVTLIKRMKSVYASQKNDTWYHLLNVLEKKIPSVKSVTFLHGEDKKTLNCLTNELVYSYTAKSHINVEDITFSTMEWGARDYGFLLQQYHAIVEKFRILVIDLNKVPGNIARIFHSLCDEESSDIKPSLFIFTLQYDKKTANLKPLERATTILKEAWGNLPQNEISPLLSRILKNVIDVVPEEKINC